MDAAPYEDLLEVSPRILLPRVYNQYVQACRTLDRLAVDLEGEASHSVAPVQKVEGWLNDVILRLEFSWKTEGLIWT